MRLITFWRKPNTILSLFLSQIKAQMKKFSTFVLLLASLCSCDDGDIITTSLEFSDLPLAYCENFEYLFYNVNPSNNQTIALTFATTENILSEEGNYSVTLGSGNQAIFRRYDAEVPADFFCNPIPPTEPIVVEEYISNAGILEINTGGDLRDADGIAAEIEDPTGLVDTDGDGLVDILDFDDDGDNVPTASEGVILNADGTINLELTLDTDGDMIPNYLDDDDDGDGILTRNEDANMDLDPTNDNNDPTNPNLDDYLNPQVAINTTINAYREHFYFLTNVEVIINLINPQFLNSNGEEAIGFDQTVTFGTYTGAEDALISVFPEFN